MNSPPSPPKRKPGAASEADDDEGEDDTAFGGLAPREGPGTGPDADPAGPRRAGQARGRTVRWLALAALAIVLVLGWLSLHGAR